MVGRYVGLCAQAEALTQADQLLIEIKVISSIDGTEQLNRVYLPSKSEAKPLLVFLHSWSPGVRARQHSMVGISPTSAVGHSCSRTFVEKTTTRKHCGSELDRQDILDAVKAVLAKTEIDRSRIYLAGTSGGGHMSMLMPATIQINFRPSRRG